MITFTVSMVCLVLGYLLYGKFLSKLIRPEVEKPTPAVAHPDGVDYVPLPKWKAYTIQFLNIAGTGPIFGAIMGAKFGVSAYVWIVVGCIFIGAMHDYISGMLSLRNNGMSLPDIIGKYLGNIARISTMSFIVVMMFFVGVFFVFAPANLLKGIFPDTNIMAWIYGIFAYYILSTLVPIDKLIGKLYPVFALALLFMAVGIMVMLYVKCPAIPEIYDGFKSFNPGKPLFPLLFVTISCGAVSGFHATQSPLMARCITSENHGRAVFYGSMITEGVIALIWAAAANAFYLEHGYDSTESAAAIVNFVAQDWLGRIGAIFAILGIVVCPISSGDTAFRSIRLMVADVLHLEQKPIQNRLTICIPLFIAAFVVLLMNMNGVEAFEIMWRYVSWATQQLATITLWAITVYLYRTKGAWHYISLIPAMFMTMVAISYFIVAPECLGLMQYYNFALCFAAAVTIALYVLFFKNERLGKTSTH